MLNTVDWIYNHASLFIGLWILFFLISFGSSLSGFFSIPKKHQARLFITFCVSSAIFLILSQIPFFFRYGSQTIDEGQMVLQARLFMNGFLPWIDIDPQTSGPLNSWVLILPSLIGLDPDWYTARWIQHFLMASTILTTVFIFARNSSKQLACIATLPLLVFYCQNQIGPLAEYQSSTLPNLMIAATLLLFLYSKNSAAALLLGVIPFAKIQHGPIALIFFIFFFWNFSWKEKRKFALLALTPFFIFCIWMVAAGGLGDFFKYYFWANLQYDARSVLSGSLSYWDSLTAMFKPPIVYVVDWHLIFMGIALLFCFAMTVWSYKKKKADLQTHVLLCWLAVSIALILKSGFLSYHYLPVFSVPIFLLTGHFLMRAPKPIMIAIPVLFTILFATRYLVYPSLLAESVEIGFESAKPVYPGLLSQTYQKVFRKGERIAVWGWSPDIYLFADRFPGTRDANSQFCFYNHPMQADYRQRFLDDMKKNKPLYFVDTSLIRESLTKPGSMEYSHFKDLKEYIEANYQYKGPIPFPFDKRPVPLWERKN